MKTTLLHYARYVRSFFGSLIGEISFAWQPPAWSRRLAGGLARSPVRSVVLLLALLTVVLGLAYLRQLWTHRPVPLETNWIVDGPHVAEPNDQFVPQQLTITFDRSVAQLDAIGKPSVSGATLRPEFPGVWHWVSGTTLVFVPTHDWPAGKNFDVKLDRALFPRQARLATLEKKLQTPPFTVSVDDLKFYINPLDPATKQITATLTFSHPVDRASLESNLRLTAQEEGALFGAIAPAARRSITYAMGDRIAYVRSARIHLPEHSGYARLQVGANLHSVEGGASLDASIEQEVLVPSLYDLFQFDSTQVILANDKDGNPVQTLVVHSTVGLKTVDLQGAIHAWVLPSRPAPKKGEPAPWNGPAEISSEVLARALPVKLDPVATEKETDATQSFRFRAAEKSQLYVTIDSGVAALGGFRLGKKYDTVCAVPPYERQIRLLHDGALLALNGERKLTIQSRGIEQLEFRVARITPGEINHLVSQSEGSFQNPIFSQSNFGESDLSELNIRHQSIASPDAGAPNYSAFDLSEFVQDSSANDGKLGLFFLHILGRRDGGYYQRDGNLFTDARFKDYQNRSGEWSDPSDIEAILSDRRLILVTDMGLVVKDNTDGTHDVFVQSIKSGEPVDGAKVQVLGKNGVPLITVETNRQGRAPIPSLADFFHEKRPVAYVVQRGRDVSFLPFARADRELNFSRFDTGGISGVAAADLSAFIFTDRGLYRPGDTAQVGLIVKQHDWRGNLAGVPLELDLIDPRGRQAQSLAVKCDSAGFVTAAFPTRDASPTGSYQVNCYLAKGDDDKTLIGSETFVVREFLPDRLKIGAKLLPEVAEGWIPQQGLSALVTLRNLYGANAIGHRVTGKVTLDPSSFHFGRYPDFSFADPYLDPKARREYHEEQLPEQTTSAAGEARFDLATREMEPSAYQLSFLAEGFEKEGGRSVAAEASVLVSPSAWLLGTRPDGDFGYVKLQSKRSLRLLAVDPHLTPIGAGRLTLKLVERRHVSVLVQQPNGNYAYDSVLKEIPVASTPIAVPAGGVDWPLRTEAAGDFAVRFYSESGDLMADVRYSVAGAGTLVRALDKNAELNAKLSKAEYKPGDEIEISITAPYTGAGLITIERDKVYATQWFKAATTSSVQKIRLPADFTGTGYVNIAFVRSLDSREIYSSPLSYAVLAFQTDREARHTTVAIHAPSLAAPGQPLVWSVTASRPTRAVVYAVDEGILQVAGYALPRPLDFFLRKEALGVGTRQTVDLILPEYSVAQAVAAAGGDGSDELLANHLNPFKRKTDQPVAFWSGVVDLGPQARNFSYRVPDYFAGSIRLMVVAASSDAVGSAETKTQVRGPFVISPNVPTFVAPGDAFDLSVTVANNVKGSGPAAPVALALTTTDGLEITQKPAATVAIDEGKDVSVHWLIRARDQLGNADLTVVANLGQSSSSLASHLSVRPPAPYLTTVDSGYFTADEKRLPVPRRLYPQFREAHALASVLPQGLTRGLGLYLEHYEYGCTEQLVSKIFPTLVSSHVMTQGQSQTEIVHRLDDIFAVLASRQNDQGAIGLWQVEPDLHFDSPSIWSMQFLTEVKERGYDIPNDLLKRGLGHLQRMAEEEPPDFTSARNQAQAIYLLTRNGTVTTNFLEHNRDWFEKNAKDIWGDDIACAYSASGYALLKNQKQADALIGRFHLTGAKMQAEDDFYNELGRDSEYIDLLALHFPQRLHKLGEADLMAITRPIMDGEYNTISAAQAVLALDAYGQAVGARNNALAGLGIDEVINAKATPLALGGSLYQEGPFDGNAEALIFHKPARNELGLPGLFYQVTQAGFEHEQVTQPISEGIEVSREYHDLAATGPTNTVRLGGQLSVVLRVRGTGDREISNVAILDLLPGGFEIVPESIQTGGCHFGGIEYADVREDRVAVFGTITNNVTEINYRIRATNKGAYAVPPPQAEAMYHLRIRARGAGGQITVTD